MLRTNYRRKYLKLLLLTVFPGLLLAADSPEYVVVLDPGHGGRDMRPFSVYGDKYDQRLQRYLDKYREGASYKGLHEHREMYDLARRTQALLLLTHTEAGRKKFHAILKKYNPSAPFPESPIYVYLSRIDGYSEAYENNIIDINGPYRLFDYPDIESGEIQMGTISRINSYRPHLVVSMHLTSGSGSKYGGLSSVVTPGFDTYKIALDYIKANESQRKSIRKSFNNGFYMDWFDGGCGKSGFYWFLCDAWIYFTGYWSSSNGLQPNQSKFRGHRYNFVNWAYRDPEWPNGRRAVMGTGPYADHLANFKAEGPFWKREQALPEKWRRENGPEGYGGDNLYASNELLRFVRYALYKNGVASYDHLPELRSPYISTWSVPTHINAISAYLEIAYIDNKYDYRRIKSFKNVHAEALASGIYSLLYGLDYPEDNREKDFPWGSKLQLERYQTYNGSDYFKEVTP